VSAAHQWMQRGCEQSVCEHFQPAGGYYGVVYYLYMFGLAALLAFDPFSRGLRFAAVAYSTLGTCFSIYFMYLQIAFIHAFCIYCLVSAVTTLLPFIAALSHFRATRAPTR
jgi:uncharacterized membrane protein